MSDPLPPLFTTDIARQSSQQAGFNAILAAIAALSGRIDELMTQDAATAAIAAKIETDQQAVLTALGSVQSLFAELETEVAAGSLSQATMDALTKAQTDMDALAATAAADVTADTPPSAAPPAPSGQ